ncbi:MAG: hypothetical protein ACU837_00970 [Gammaproteobacteria bacterium]
MSFFGLSAQAVEFGRPVEIFKASHLHIVDNTKAPVGNRHKFNVPGPLPFDAEALATAKAAAEGENLTPDSSLILASLPAGPKVVKGFSGIKNANVAPPDTTGAVGKTRYIELSNSEFRISDKNAALKNAGSLAALFGWPAKIDGPSVFDPQVIWDPSTNRFFITGDIIVARDTEAAQFYLAYVFSKTDTPNSAADFCQYALGPLSNFPDYPKLGDTKDVILIGTNTFSPADAFIESDIFSISKPPAGKSCPDPSRFTARVFGPLKTSSGATAFTPVPANQIDGSSIGWVVGRPAALPGKELALWKITSSKSGNATIANLKGEQIPVPSYTVPQSAPQPGTPYKLDTLDARPTQAISAVNPARNSKVSLWTQHTVSHENTLPPPFNSPSGAEVRWYEIDPVNGTLFSKGKLTSTSRFYFNGSISPDRVVNGSTKKFGSTMVLQASSTSTGILPLAPSALAYIPQIYPSIYAVSKKGNNAQSAVKLVKQGTLILDDFTCADDAVCRWGDYSALTPDPAPPNLAKRTKGRVWGNNELGGGASSATVSAPWQTWNFILDP